jgi:hypothetical protein
MLPLAYGSAEVTRILRVMVCAFKNNG